nr:nitroreductase [Desulfobacterales bacterium]
MEKDYPVYEAVLNRRTIRRFKSVPISGDILRKLVNAARVAPSAANIQPLEYVVVTDFTLRQDVFEALRWAAYIKPPWRPEEYERPVAYIVVLVNSRIKTDEFPRDVGASIENMMLVALEEGIGSCWLRAVDRKIIRKSLNIPEHMEIDSVLALGYPRESPVMVEMTDSIRYWRESGVHYVPKRRLEDIIHFNGYTDSRMSA